MEAVILARLFDQLVAVLKYPVILFIFLLHSEATGVAKEIFYNIPWLPTASSFPHRFDAYAKICLRDILA